MLFILFYIIIAGNDIQGITTDLILLVLNMHDHYYYLEKKKKKKKNRTGFTCWNFVTSCLHSCTKPIPRGVLP